MLQQVFDDDSMTRSLTFQAILVQTGKLDSPQPAVSKEKHYNTPNMMTSSLKQMEHLTSSFL